MTTHPTVILAEQPAETEPATTAILRFRQDSRPTVQLEQNETPISQPRPITEPWQSDDGCIWKPDPGILERWTDHDASHAVVVPVVPAHRGERQC